jgi:hypothetical protein
LPDFPELGELSDLTASLVVGQSGNYVSDLGTSKGLGNAADFALLKHLRSRSQVVLTSGLTARLEQYKMPSTADLAILSRSGGFVPEVSDGREVIQLGEQAGYFEATAALRELGYDRIHTEFGAAGFTQLARQAEVDCILSSTTDAGLQAFCEQKSLAMINLISLPGLFIARVRSVAR